MQKKNNKNKNNKKIYMPAMEFELGTCGSNLFESR